MNFDLGEDSPVFTVDDVPEVFFQGGKVHGFSIGRDRHAVASAFKGDFPNDFVGRQIDALESVECADVDAVELLADTDALDVGGTSVRVKASGGNAFSETMMIVDIEDQQTVSSVAEVITDSRCGDVEKMTCLRRALCGQRW